MGGRKTQNEYNFIFEKFLTGFPCQEAAPLCDAGRVSAGAGPRGDSGTGRSPSRGATPTARPLAQDQGYFTPQKVSILTNDLRSARPSSTLL